MTRDIDDDGQPGTPIRILLIDDDVVDRENLRRLLRHTKLEVVVTEAGSARAALSLLEEYHFDVVLLDVRLGDASGSELLPCILGETGERRCAVIMVTGQGDERSLVHAMRAGVYDYLAKGSVTSEALELAILGSMRWLEHDRQLREARERLTRLGMYDPLTGLPNRTLFFDRLEQARAATQRGAPPFALLMMDLDFFKEVNDTLGHEAGDLMLCEVGNRLREITRSNDSFARVGGDEFSGLLHGVDSVAAAVIVAEKISASVRQPVVIEGQMVSVGISIGIVLVNDASISSRILLSWADQAMYSAKRAGRDYEIFSDRGEVPEPRPLLIAAQLPTALERGEIYLHYQPKIDLGTGEMVGVEALARWTSPTLGEVAPGEFIPIAERSAAIQAITRRVVELALDQHDAWCRDGVVLPVAVNLSPRSLDDEGLPEFVRHALAVRNIAPRLLTLELTETALVSNTSRARNVLEQIRAMGVGLSIDDFGAGFTSFRYLRDFEVSEIKVDGMFVAQLQRAQRDQSIVRSVAELAKGFGVKLVAEGIESEALWPMLRSLGCHVGQGFSIARPMSGTDVPSWSGHWSRRLETRKEFYRGVRRLRVNDLLNTTDIAPSYGSPN
ncbi:MAG: GGDEF domain-containing response regulator [bacterium]